MYIRFIAASVLFLTLSATNAEEIDIAAGKALAEKNCYACHGDQVYTREDRRVTSQQKLTAQVQRCQLQLGLQWFDEDVNNTAAYLNNAFYRFK